tara:strand:- start:325 stop:513 length:189 start_codon:yes stop_codon:yes gene_type:complete
MPQNVGYSRTKNSSRRVTKNKQNLKVAGGVKASPRAKPKVNGDKKKMKKGRKVKGYSLFNNA